MCKLNPPRRLDGVGNLEPGHPPVGGERCPRLAVSENRFDSETFTGHLAVDPPGRCSVDGAALGVKAVPWLNAVCYDSSSARYVKV